MASISIDVIKSIFVASIHVLATKSGSHVTLKSLMEAYERNMGQPVPFRDHGYGSVEELIRVGLPQSLSLYRVGANMCVKSTQPLNANSKRIVQKISTETNYGRKRSSGGGASRGRGGLRQPQSQTFSCPESVRQRVARLVEKYYAANNGEGCGINNFGARYFEEYGLVLRLEQYGCDSMQSFGRFLQSCGVVGIVETRNGEIRFVPSAVKSGDTSISNDDSEKLISLVSDWQGGMAPLDELASVYCSRYGSEAYRRLGFRSFDGMVTAESRLRLLPRSGGASPLVRLASNRPPVEMPPTTASSDFSQHFYDEKEHQQRSHAEQQQLQSPQESPTSSVSSTAGDLSSMRLASVTACSDLDRSDSWSVLGDGLGSGSGGVPADCAPIGYQLQPLNMAEFVDSFTGRIKVSVRATCPDDLLLTVHSNRLDEQRRLLTASMEACNDWQPISRRHAAVGGLLCAARIGGVLTRVHALGYEGAPRAGRVRVRPLDLPVSTAGSDTEVVSLSSLFYLKMRFAEQCCQLTALAYLDCLTPASGDGQWNEAASHFFCHLMETSSEPKVVQLVQTLFNEPPYNCSVIFIRPLVASAMIEAKHASEPELAPYLKQPLTEF